MENRKELTFTFSSYGLLKKDEKKLIEIINHAKILKSGDAKILKEGDFYLNNKFEGLYRVTDFKSRKAETLHIIVDPIHSLKENGFSRFDDNIRGELVKQIVHILDVKRENNV